MSGNGNGTRLVKGGALTTAQSLHPAWEEFIRYCQDLQFGEVEKLKIQHGVPMMAELTTRKVKFGSNEL